MTAAMTSRTPVIAALDAGTYYHHRTFHTPELTPYLDRFIYLPELDDAALADCDALIVSCRTHPDLLVPHRARFARFLASGRTLVAMGETGSHRWLDGVHWTDCEVNFWWWKTPGADSGLRLAQPAHPLFSHLTLADATWHQHGTFTPPPGAVSLIDKAGAGSVLYEDRHSTAGRLIVTSLDPMYHHGSYFMPAASRFLRGFLPWLKASTPAA
ncbi:hypothetical protein [Achromobacter xylosoxidans]|uniref:hypothetical protein n=1 Tax=Alcaligenes xylosoxydans xylosoxydans TaxID=85698 RepID=UPI0003D6243A|nr:hypothetical protein [Achromobacter xylosoxidans]AHC48698.1 hypothetical protein AX27061_4239 [Achromobacter xylosoxidans NBRC 15126 = ATCC 27061]AUZ18558.1 hypothetical protein AL509_03995 [Achromobacter xylosoxidans]AXA78860.1 hypothetical protein CE206_21615 [Achromobacter xylosoxidans]MCH1985038.1 hypothetical protein [Achromobacter xylosoxidans]MCH1995046.1 hypothetical protein [Achromobacter xylosoxidans]